MEWTFELLRAPDGPLLTEGPVWTGDALLFTHIRASRILRLDTASGRIGVWREGTGNTNGMAVDAQGRLYGCSSGRRAIVRFERDGTDTVVSDRLDGRRLNTPNDLAIDAQGRIWFTDPWNPANLEPGAVQALDHCSVLRADPQPDGSYRTVRVAGGLTKPNGILLSADERTLYVAESGFARGTARELRAYPIADDGRLGPHAVLFTWGEDHRDVHRGIDGMCLDAEGNIVACTGWSRAGPGPLIQVMTPQGRVLETHPSPVDIPTNCCFGGADLSTFYLTTYDGHLYQARTGRRGWPLPRPA
ncbi:SMP-30/gluconolactonase/LRE family protein [Paracidovorax cattleyae]|uniref:Gluconolactonase n=1 Tax=Paracidovorax cattleyae TaxID=80868 RepID=A0A1H0WAL6_9BURK|nr:SMP-30/gluconolactonase/LRE family protein [Paracidovorax cattleyae]SDP87678.1 gluconolactonase [Paracidovorax cattleyae]